MKNIESSRVNYKVWVGKLQWVVIANKIKGGIFKELGVSQKLDEEKSER